MALRRCTALPPETFLDEVFGRRHLHTPAKELGAGDNTFDDLFSLQALETLFGQGLQVSAVRLVRDGVEMPVTGADGFADTDHLRNGIAAGQTLIVRSVHRLHPPVRQFAHRLAADLGHPVTVNAFVTPASSVGVDLHFDVQDVMVLQIAGEKTWRLRTPPFPDPLPADAWFDVTAARRQEMLAASAPLDDLVLRPGDTLYFPRGTFHAPETGGELSLHLTFAIAKITRADVLTTMLRPAAAADPWLRESVDLASFEDDPAALRDLAVRLAASLTAAAKSVDPCDLLWSVRRLAHAGIPLEPSPVLPSSGATAYRLRDGAHHRVVREAASLKVTVGGRHVRLPGALGSVLDALRRDRRVDVHALTSVIGADLAAQALQALVGVGLLLPDDTRGPGAA